MSKSQMFLGETGENGVQERKHFAILAVLGEKDFAILAYFGRKDFAKSATITPIY